MFDEQSRYARLPLLEAAMPDGRRVAYVSRRLLPAPDSYVAAGRVTVTDSDRLDLMAAQHLGTPAGFYLIADANEAMHPAELTEKAGKRLVIPLPRAGDGS